MNRDAGRPPFRATQRIMPLAFLMVLAAVALPSAVQAQSLKQQRDRLLQGLASVPGGQFYGKGDACGVWKSMEDSQRYYFLMVTDIWGQRSRMFNDPANTAQALQYIDRLLWIRSTCPEGTHWVKGPGTDGYCYDNASYAYVGPHECGTENRNRLYFQASPTLASYITNYDYGLPQWAGDSDPNLHGGFTQNAGYVGQGNSNIDATGQLQYFAWPQDPDRANDGYPWLSNWQYLCSPKGLGFACTGGGAAPSWAQYVVEHDFDFDSTHESSATCYYGDGFYGFTKYWKAWNNIITADTPHYDYAPCQDDTAGATRCAFATEDAWGTGAVTLSCPGSVINNIGFASYGAPDTFQCGNYRQSSCHSSNSASIFQQQCLNRTSCTVSSAGGQFGDPCSGWPKKFGVQYTCCQPTTSCAAQGKTCGQLWNGCGYETCGSLGGSCAGGQTCSNNVCTSSAPTITSEWDAAGRYYSAMPGNYVYVSGTGFGSCPYVWLGGTYESIASQSANQLAAYVYPSTAMGGQYLYVYCNGTWSSPVYVTVQGTTATCSLSESPSTVYSGQSYSYYASISTPAPYAYWEGTKNGVTDAIDAPESRFANTTYGVASFTNPGGLAGTYQRYVRFKDAAGNTVCTTNSVYTTLY